ncbi:MAG: hypothetical protein AAFX02_08515 [Pseudomonadota bacterium]
MTTIIPGRSYHAGPKSPFYEVRKQEEAEREAKNKGDVEEADRCYERKQLALARLAQFDRTQRQKLAAQTPPKPGKRDPLSTFPRRLRAAGDALRDTESANSLRLGPGFTSDFVEGGQSAGMESLIDRRRKHDRAWQFAFGAVNDAALRQSAYNIIVYRCSIASQLKKTSSSAERKSLTEAIWSALDAAAYYYEIETV